MSTKRLWLTHARLPSAASKPTRNGTRSTTHGARPTRTTLPCMTASRPANCRKASTRLLTTLSHLRSRQGCRHSWRLRLRAQRHRRRHAGTLGRSADLGGSNKTDLKALPPSLLPSAPPSSGRSAARTAVSCTSACASSPWVPSPTASCWAPIPVRSVAPSSCSPTTSVPLCVWPPSCRFRTCMCGPTTPSPSAKMVRPTSRWSTWLPSVPSRSLRSSARPTLTRPPKPTVTSSRRRTLCLQPWC